MDLKTLNNQLENYIDELEKNNIDEADIEDEYILALADYLEVSPEEVKELGYGYYGLRQFELEETEGAYVVTDDYGDAVRAAEEDVRDLLDELGFAALNWDAIGGFENFIDEHWLEDFWREYYEQYAEDIDIERYGGENRLAEEMKEQGLNPEDYGFDENTLEFDDLEGAIADFAEKCLEAIQDDMAGQFIFVFGDGRDVFEWLENAGALDTDKIVETAVEVDGPANSLAIYDGKEVEHDFNDKTYYIYRTD